MKTPESCVKRAWHWIKVFLFLLLPLAIMPILAGWVGDVSKDGLKGVELGAIDCWLLGGGLAGLVLLAILLVWKGRALLPAKVIAQTPAFEQRRVVVALLSPCDGLKRPNGEWEFTPRDKPPIPLAGKTLDELVDKSCVLPGLTWQQTLRAAHYHRTRLEKLVLVGSLGGSGSNAQLDQAREFFSTWFPGKVVVPGSPTRAGDGYDTRWQADFEDLNSLGNLLDNLLRELRKDTAGYRDRDIIIDCTGGYKVTSIAAALATLHRAELMFQYVGTGDHAGRITGFNVATEASLNP
ncbi:MAG: hypothetical protein Q8Q28_13370 [Pseudomonadota bacterium]|nr:hypothetical protein [Pseudomonadota bacterium]